MMVHFLAKVVGVVFLWMLETWILDGSVTEIPRKLLGAIAMSVLLVWTETSRYQHWGPIYNEWICLGNSCFYAGLLVATFSDIKEKQVLRIVWMICIFLLTIVLLFQKVGFCEWLCLAEFVFLQECICNHFYGQADAHSYICCVVYAMTNGFIEEDIMLAGLQLMIISFVLLAVLNLFMRNINRFGNLKQPVAFIPYIVVALNLWIGIS